MTFPETTILALVGQATGDSFGAPFEFHAGAAEYARRSFVEERYIDCREDCKLPFQRCRTKGLYTDDTQQALVLLWIWAQMADKGKDPLKAHMVGDLFYRVCSRMAKEPVSPKSHSFGVHRGTGKNFREAIAKGEPPDTAGLGAAMRVGPVATLLPSPAVLIPWMIEVSSATTCNPVALASAAMFGLRVWFASRNEAPRYDLNDLLAPSTNIDHDVRVAWGQLLDAYRTLSLQGEPALLSFASKGASRELRCAADGFALTGVPWVLHCVDQGTSFSDVLERACASGGDTDTVCAMAGCVAALLYGRADIPPWMLDGLVGLYHLDDPSLWHPVGTEAAYVGRDVRLCDQLAAAAQAQARASAPRKGA